LGKYHVVGVSGERARKMYLDARDLHFDNGYATLHGIGPELTLPIHGIFEPTFQNGRSYFHRRLLDLTRSEPLARRLPALIEDTRAAFEALGKVSSNITNPFTACYPVTVALSCRTVGSEEIPNDSKLLQKCLNYCLILQSTCSAQVAAAPWLPSLAFLKRAYARYGLHSLIAPIVKSRIKNKSESKDDALQILIDNGDSEDYITNFYISTLFAALVNTGVLAGGLLTVMAHHTEWQEKIFQEIKAAASAHSEDKRASLVEQLGSMPLEAWETSFPTIDICFKELIRMNAAFPMFRQNTGSKPIVIAGTNQVIPKGSFACYHTADAHYNEELYPDPWKFDPLRFAEGREEFKRQPYGCKYHHRNRSTSLEIL
jgi:cytochrome P450